MVGMIAPRALCFDVFGTVVDWRGSIMREVAALAAARGLPVDAAAFADAWRDGYQPAMARVRSGELPWTTIDGLHRLILDGLIDRFGLASLTTDERAHLNRAWHRLDGWPDATPGLQRLKHRMTIASLSNGNLSLLVAMARHAGLPWDCVLSAELFHHYKPDPQVYLGAAQLLDLTPREVMMVAAHPSDLRAAARCGLATAYVRRPLERGPGGPMEPALPGEFDLEVDSFLELADRLGA
jgi:2-haloacid dehalogenase